MEDDSASTEPPPPAGPEQQAQEDEDEDETQGRELLVASQAGDLQRVEALLAEGAPAYYQVCIDIDSACLIYSNSTQTNTKRSR